MHSKLVWSAACALAATLMVADTAHAQQTVNFTLGYFAVRGEDGRIADDVVNENLGLGLYSFDVKDFNSASIGGEWLFPIGDYLEAGVGVQFSSRTVPSVYFDLVRPNGNEIEQDFKLRIVPITGTVRVLPLGRNAPVQPYVGAGIGIFNWRYSEVGDFVDFTTPNRQIFSANYEESGTSIGPVAVFGLRVPLGQFSLGGELRYQKAEGDLDTTDFLAPKIDLGGWHYQATFGVRF